MRVCDCYLERLPLSRLKIEKSFMRDVFKDTNGAVIAGTIVALARSLWLASVAEGVTQLATRLSFRAGMRFLPGLPVQQTVPTGAVEKLLVRPLKATDDVQVIAA